MSGQRYLKFVPLEKECGKNHDCAYCYANGFYGYRGEPKSMLDELEGEIYERKTERLFEY